MAATRKHLFEGAPLEVKNPLAGKRAARFVFVQGRDGVESDLQTLEARPEEDPPETATEGPVEGK